ncbi:hypothetical protein ACLKA7_003960 [Drosophila subpalustris]
MNQIVDINVDIGQEITRINHIGFGSFGDVYTAKWKKNTATRQLRSRSLDTQQIRTKNEDKYHIILEYADCGSLYNFLHNTEHAISYTGKLNWILQCATGIAYLHAKNIMHRDLKSENILLFENYHSLKLCDFGTGKKIMSNNTANTGTANYMAPEVAKGVEYDAKCDVYSFGIIFWEIMSRMKPFYHLGDIASLALQGKVTNEKARPNLDDIKNYTNSNHIKPIIEKCWHPEPKERPTMKGLAFTLSIEPSLFSDRPELLALVKKLPEISDDDFQLQ